MCVTNLWIWIIYGASLEVFEEGVMSLLFSIALKQIVNRADQEAV